MSPLIVDPEPAGGLDLIPDVETLVGELLRVHPDMVALGARVAGSVPSSARGPWVRVTQLDAAKVPGTRPDWFISYLVQFDCYAGATAMESHSGQAEANDLARTVRAVLDDAIGRKLDGVTVTDVQFTSMARVPDTGFEPARERYVLDAQLWTHP